jgi:ABC-type polysaccharide/polyol phosphate transport system ATPase subunit
MSDKYGIELKNVTVSFRSYKERPTSFKESIVRFVKDRKLRHYTTFEALSEINLKVPRGSIYGVIGSNGAGKSTLLRTVTGVLKPIRGKVITHGKVGSLIKLGAGFDAELNAIENIYLYSSLHGKSAREIAAKVPDILDFAELKEFAQTPIKYYSAGMRARLGFACAMDIEPDVLVVDEVLSVGDERFREKCRAVFEQLIKDDKTVLMVSHNLSSLSTLADQIAVLSKGCIIYQGDPKEAIRIYRDTKYETALDGRRM